MRELILNQQHDNQLDPEYAWERQRIINEEQARLAREVGKVGLGKIDHDALEAAAYAADIQMVKREMEEKVRNRGGMFNPAV